MLYIFSNTLFLYTTPFFFSDCYLAYLRYRAAFCVRLSFSVFLSTICFSSGQLTCFVEISLYKERKKEGRKRGEIHLFDKTHLKLKLTLTLTLKKKRNLLNDGGTDTCFKGSHFE